MKHPINVASPGIIVKHAYWTCLNINFSFWLRRFCWGTHTHRHTFPVIFLRPDSDIFYSHFPVVTRPEPHSAGRIIFVVSLNFFSFFTHTDKGPARSQFIPTFSRLHFDKLKLDRLTTLLHWPQLTAPEHPRKIIHEKGITLTQRL